MNKHIAVKKVLLTEEEAIVVNKITISLGMDCWCTLIKVDNGYMIYDSENRRVVATKKAIKDIYEGLTIDLPPYEFKVFISLAIRLKVLRQV